MDRDIYSEGFFKTPNLWLLTGSRSRRAKANGDGSVGTPLLSVPPSPLLDQTRPRLSGSRLGIRWKDLITVAGRKAGQDLASVKQDFLTQMQRGMNINQALEVIGRNRSTYERWRREDSEFLVAVERIKNLEKISGPREREWISFPDFSEKYLDAKVFPHMTNVVDMLEGRDPTWTHPSMTFEKGERDLVMVNMPPEHAKTTSITINYVCYRICMDPNIRVILVSKTAEMAKKMLYAIKTRLTHPRYDEMITAYAPMGGFDKNSEAWNQTMIYVSDDARDSGEKDPTVQALGIRGHIYGARADLIILDDTVDLTNAHEYDKQIDWLQSEVISRVSASGSMLVVGTRLAAKDLYSELRDPHRYPDEESPWSYLSMPAVLDFKDDPKDWVTLWPKSNQPEPGSKADTQEADEDGLYPKWDGSRLFQKRRRVSPRAWAMVYQQQQVSDDAIFNGDAIKASINGNRMAGPIPKGMVNCRPQGMEGLVIVAGLDPATAGHTAAVVVGLDIKTQKRYILDIYNKPGITPEAMREMIKGWTDRYNISEWRIERNGFQGFLVHDRELNEFCSSRGSVIKPHFTGQNKHDADFGVASMTILWNGWEDGYELIELPSTHGQESAKQLIEQLVTWHPGAPKNQKTDIVMALWFAELACRDRVTLASNYTRSHVNNAFLTPWDRSQQTTVSLLEAEASGAWKPIGA